MTGARRLRGAALKSAAGALLRAGGRPDPLVRPILGVALRILGVALRILGVALRILGVAPRKRGAGPD